MPPFDLTTTNALIGRQRTVEQIKRKLLARLPANVAVVGPRRMGKSTIFRHLCEQLRAEKNCPFQAIVYWDFAPTAISTDNIFWRTLQGKIIDALRSAGREEADILPNANDQTDFDAVKESCDELDDDDISILFVFDGIDRLIMHNEVSAHLFENLRSLFDGTCHTAIRGTRKLISEMNLSDELIGSPFWNLFDPAFIRIGPLDEEDRNQFIEHTELQFDQGGRTELSNWTGGHPILLLTLLNELSEGESGTLCNNEVVCQASVEMMDRCRELIGELWQDCDSEEQQIFVSSMRGNVPQIAGVSQRLIQKGFVDQQGNPSCRLIEKYVEQEHIKSETLLAAFQSPVDYVNNIRSFLEARLACTTIVDNELHRIVRGAINDLPQDPETCLGKFSTIVNAALRLILSHECPDDVVPEHVQNIWLAAHQFNHNESIQNLITFRWKVPSERGQMISLLRKLTGCEPNHPFNVLQARKFGKDIFYCVDIINDLRNLGQHAGGQTIPLNLAVTGTMACIDLLELLARDLES